MLDVFHQQVKGVLRVRLDQLELRQGIVVGLDVVAVLRIAKLKAAYLEDVRAPSNTAYGFVAQRT
jgi:predicted dinucleotide-utilizing enzyme